MNRSSKGFGLSSVVATVVLLIIVAIFSASARSDALLLDGCPHWSKMPSQADALHQPYKVTSKHPFQMSL
ncbi:MAG: hypothetical protein ACI88A_000011 [Paraglaciecola sp.]|jgi:hypothetical protein